MMKNYLLKRAVESTRNGELDGFEKLYILTYREAYHQACSITKEFQAAWDVLKDVYVDLYKDRTSLFDEEKVLLKISGLVDEFGYEWRKKNMESPNGQKPDIAELNERAKQEIIQELDASEEKASMILLQIEEEAKVIDSSKDQESIEYIFSAVKGSIAVGVLIAAIFIVTSSVQKVQNYNEQFKELWDSVTIQTLAESTSHYYSAKSTTASMVVSPGWVDTVAGWKYMQQDKTYIMDTWKRIDGILYYFDTNGIMADEEVQIDNQIFTFWHDGKLVGLRRVDDTIELNDTSQESGIWKYYLKKSVTNNREGIYDLYRVLSDASDAEQEELFIENIQDYFIWDNIVYYMQEGVLQEKDLLSVEFPFDDEEN